MSEKPSEIEIASEIPDIRTDIYGKPFKYIANNKVKSEGTVIAYTEEMVKEIIKCRNDIEYFAKNYYKIVHQDFGFVNIDLRDYQLQCLNEFTENRFNIAKWPRQSGKSTTFAVWVCHYILFHKHKEVVILANKERHSKELLRRIKIAYQELPFWLQVDVMQWSKLVIQLSNGCKVSASSTSVDSIRGEAVGVLIVDECAFIPSSIWSEFYESVYPSISAAKTSKIILVSTPKGMNHYYKLWTEGIKHQNNYNPIEIQWFDVPNYAKTDRSGLKFEYEPGNTVYDFKDLESNKLFSMTLSDMEKGLNINKENRQYEVLIDDDWEDFYGILKHRKLDHKHFTYDIIYKEWYKETVANLGLRKFSQEFGCRFLASTDSLITNEVIEDMVFAPQLEPHDIPFYDRLIKINSNFERAVSIYNLPEMDHEYTLGVDPAQITIESSGDSVSIQILDVTELPFKQVGTIIINEGVHYSELPAVIKILATTYNEALVFIENNDTIGIEIAESLLLDHEYDLVFSEKAGVPGFRTTTKKKKLGCLNLKMLVETRKLIINDIDTISQISTFIKKKNSYEAEMGYNDDAVMALMHSLVFLQDRMGYEHKRHLVDGMKIEVEKEDIIQKIRNRNNANEEDEDNEPMPFGFRNDSYEEDFRVF